MKLQAALGNRLENWHNSGLSQVLSKHLDAVVRLQLSSWSLFW